MMRYGKYTSNGPPPTPYLDNLSSPELGPRIEGLFHDLDDMDKIRRAVDEQPFSTPDSTIRTTVKTGCIDVQIDQSDINEPTNVDVNLPALHPDALEHGLRPQNSRQEGTVSWDQSFSSPNMPICMTPRRRSHDPVQHTPRPGYGTQEYANTPARRKRRQESAARERPRSIRTRGIPRSPPTPSKAEADEAVDLLQHRSEAYTTPPRGVAHTSRNGHLVRHVPFRSFGSAKKAIWRMRLEEQMERNVDALQQITDELDRNLPSD